MTYLLLLLDDLSTLNKYVLLD